MARAASTPKKEISMEEALWKSADKLRGSVEPAEYKHVVLSLFFLKFASDKFEAQRKAITEKYGEKFVDMLPSIRRTTYSSCLRSVVGLSSWRMRSRMTLHCKLTPPFIRLKKRIPL